MVRSATKKLEVEMDQLEGLNYAELLAIDPAASDWSA